MTRLFSFSGLNDGFRIANIVSSLRYSYSSLMSACSSAVPPLIGTVTWMVLNGVPI